MKVEIKTLDAKKAGTLDLPDNIFALPERVDILHRAINWQLAKQRAGTHKVKGRSEITGTGAKMYRQKGTGGARHGDKKVSQFRGGGRAFGPVVRSHMIGLPKKVRKLALKTALSVKQAKGKLIIVDEAKLSAPKTKEFISKIEKLGLTSALIIDGAEVDGNILRASANVPNIDILPSMGANVYDILRRDVLVLTKDAVAALEARLV